MHCIVRRCYAAYALFNGTFQSCLDQDGRETLRRKLAIFIPQFLSTYKLKQTPFFNAMEGISFFPCDKNVFLQIQCLVNLVEKSFGEIKETFVMNRDLLMWSGLEQRDTRTLYNYLCIATDKYAEEESGTSKPYLPSVPVTGAISSASRHELQYVNLLRAMQKRSGLVRIPPRKKDQDDKTRTLDENLAAVSNMYIGENSSQKRRVAIYSGRRGVSCVFLMDPEADTEYYVLNDFVKSHLSGIAPHINTRIVQTGDIFDGKLDYYCLYYNDMNNAAKGMWSTASNSGDFTFPTHATHAVMRMHNDFGKRDERPSEIVMRTSEGRWLVGRKSEQRELYVLFEDKDTINSIIDVHEFLQRLNTGYFGNLFLD